MLSSGVDYRTAPAGGMQHCSYVRGLQLQFSKYYIERVRVSSYFFFIEYEPTISGC